MIEGMSLFPALFDTAYDLWKYNDQQNYQQERDRNMQNYQSSENQKARDFQAEQARISRDWEEQQKLVERQYNSPAAQMQRYKQAGLNLFLAGGASANPGLTTAPSSPAYPAVGFSGSPSGLGLPSLSTGHFSGMAALALQQKKVDADAANQQSQAVKSIIEACVPLLKDGRIDAAQKIMDRYLPMIAGVNSGSSLFMRQAQNEVKAQELQLRINGVEADIAESVGRDKASAVLHNLRQQYNESVEKTNLFKTLETLNNKRSRLVQAQTGVAYAEQHRIAAEINKIDSEIKYLGAAAYNQFEQGALAGSHTLTQDQLRSYWVSMTQKDALIKDMDYERFKADFESEGYERGLKTSAPYKFMKAWNAGTEEFISKPFGRAIDLISSGFPKLQDPTKYVKYNKHFMDQRGYKGTFEYFDKR